jgi:altronate hydrolase
VAVALTPIAAEEIALGVTALEAIPAGHKLALRDIPKGENVLKYGMPIGRASADIPRGAWVHTHNLKTNLDAAPEYAYHPAPRCEAQPFSGGFMGYQRADGAVGIRNELWILPTVGCVGGIAEALARRTDGAFGVPVHAFPHPYGCSQLGEDHRNTRKILARLARHPNAGGVLVLGLGCENNHIAAFREALGPVDGTRVRFLNAQDVPDELQTGVELIQEIARAMQSDVRTMQPLSKLVLGLKCGGSDGFSGLTANPLVGAVTDSVCASGGSALLTEVPEMFGAETLLMERCGDEALFHSLVEMVGGFKRFFESFGQPVNENPSPGNKAGGITTLEEKSLGCTQKGGTGPVSDVLGYGEARRRSGLTLVAGPGNDLVAATALTAAGAQLILFTTGRGTPLGAPVPTLKIASNALLAERKRNWIDFDASPLLSGASMNEMAERLLRLILDTASGAPAKNEISGERQIAIFKTGVTL